MSELSVKTVTGGTASVGQTDFDALAGALSGSLMGPDSPGYDEARTLWNAMVDRRPGLIAECATTQDVARSVTFAKDHGLLVSVGGAGHNIAGNAVCDDGFMISLRNMKAVLVDAGGQRATVEPGVTLGELDSATQEYGLALPVGINSTTGIAGLTLGGGFGWLSRKHGLTADNLISAELVTAQGEVLTVSSDENSDLFWGIRGGGGNFGIVTSFEFKLHPLGPEVLSGLIVYPFSEAGAVLRNYREFAAQAPDEVTVWVVMRKAPPLPFLPEEVHGTEVVILAALYAGDMAEGEEAFKDLRAFGNPIADVISPHQFTDFQAAFDPLLTPGERNYWKSHDFLAMSDELLDAAMPFVESLPSDSCEVFFAQMGGATNRVPADATAYRHRDAEYIMNVHGRWHDAGDDERCVAWCRGLFDATTPFATGGVYVNFMTEEEGARVESAYGDSYQRLVALKDKYDPDNFFRFNQNVRPSSSA
ncbi:MAG: FAD-binding oxidoreductase [Gemmatimonadetes bacterium]|nr:FAD-binding oxidoreductase [Gemmatimonadota bacterium]NNM03477.1 FAD-binding oxidoreductase [Gemmatimonadota bacterium]